MASLVEEANNRHEQLNIIKNGKKSSISNIFPGPVSWCPSHQQQKGLPPDPDEVVRDGNDAADRYAKEAIFLEPVKDTMLPVSNHRFVCTIDCRLICGEFSKFLRQFAQTQAVGRMIRDVEQLRSLVSLTTNEVLNMDSDVNDQNSDEIPSSNARRSSRISSIPGVSYSEDNDEIRMDEEGGFIDVEDNERTASKPTTQGVVVKSLIANPAFCFNPNDSFQELMIAGHRFLSHTRQIRGDRKLREQLLTSKAQVTKNKLHPRYTSMHAYTTNRSHAHTHA